MKQSTQFIIGVLVSICVFIITIFIGSIIGPYSNEIGYVVVAIAIMCGVMAICTSAIIETIKEHSK